jgi:nitroimidazol reductase NimA-like FMN-containing flavoprotein (pyridoxamine 5'-phosphate oxidase superfamily)
MAAQEGGKPVFSILSPAECEAVLSRNHIGRLAFINDGRVDIEPVSYVASGPWLFMRSAEGAKLAALAHTPYVAFEVDEVKSAIDWQSVVVRGTIYWLADDGRYVDRSTLDRAIEALRSFQPQALGDDDPTPFRRTIYGLHTDLMTGRKSEPDVDQRSDRATPAGPQPRSSRRHTPDGS